MFARDLERVLHLLTAEGDFRPYAPRDIEKRFESLRGYGKLPRGREKRVLHLEPAEIASTILGLVPANPVWAGHAAAVLAGLKPVGGIPASFRSAETLSRAIEALLAPLDGAEDVLDLSLSAAAVGIENHGSAMLRWQRDGAVRTTYFVSGLAASLMQPGAENAFKPEMLRSPFSRVVVLAGQFFNELRREIARSTVRPGQPEGDGSEYDEEEAREARAKRLGAGPGSRFLNIGVDTQATWPQEETVVAFDRYRLVLLPRTKESTQSVHIDLHAHKLSDEAAMTVINRFLSLLAWCDDQFAVAQGGWSGNPVPVAVAKRNLAFATSPVWLFERCIPSSDQVVRALGHYREARNAEYSGLVSYAVLSYYKIIEVGCGDNNAKIGAWITANYAILEEERASDPSFVSFKTAIGTQSPEAYLRRACRHAVAHAKRHSPSDVDDMTEVRRLLMAATVLRRLARRMIGHDLGFPDGSFE